MNSVRGMIFVGGIHREGKSAFSANLAGRLSIPHLNSGTLLATLLARHRQRSYASGKPVSGVGQNRECLLQPIRSLQLWRPTWFIQDGHFCPLKESSSVEHVSNETFRSLNPAAVIVIEHEISVIQRRLRDHDQREYSMELLSGFSKTGNENS
jgi:hypothetical protein